MKNRISVIIVDDHPIVLQGFSNILQNEENIDLLRAFTSVTEGMTYLEQHEVDVILLDINMPDINGIEACGMINKRYPRVKVIAISNNNEHSIIQRMLQSGASGYILKNASADELIQCIWDAEAGATALSKDIQQIIHNAQTKSLPKITRRESEILRLLAQGRTTPEIADIMFVSPLTIETHRRNLIQKFKVNNVAALIHKATELKYI